MVAPEARYLHNGDLVLRFPYDRWLVEELKTMIPAHARSYDPATKAWTVEAWCAAIAIGIARHAYPAIRVIPASSTKGPDPIRTTDPNFAELHLLPSAPAELVEAAYKVLARKHHPDVGGDSEAMKRLNAAYGALRGRRAA